MTFSRACGVLLHPSSLPGPHGSGDLGPAAYHFVDWLVGAQQKLWQILPLGGLGAGNSPYMSSSAFAGNVLLIDLEELQARGWLQHTDLAAPPAFSDNRIDFGAVAPWRMERLHLAATHFARQATDAARAGFSAFCGAQASWLPDYALFMALADAHDQAAWCDWAQPLAQRDPSALLEAAAEHAETVAFWKFCQWCFFRQWHRLRAYANARAVRIVGDAPIFIAYQSAEVWARQELFELDAQGRATVVAGVPPDFFSSVGQRWGNPLYRWSAHASEGYAWWTERIRRIFEMVDMVRIDHFRGFAGYWEIPASQPTAVHGRWLPGPGSALFTSIRTALGPLPIIAEDLGIITPDVDALRKEFGMPGMRVLQFAFGEGKADDNINAYLPHNYDENTVVYTGTHDNDTTAGWWSCISPAMRQHVCEYLSVDGCDVHWSLIRAACASVANTAILPLQDVLGLDGAHRMNRPGQPDANWEWRFTWTQVEPMHAGRLAHFCRLYGRDGPGGMYR
jgi:4-alpha-glucanotransferase